MPLPSTLSPRTGRSFSCPSTMKGYPWVRSSSIWSGKCCPDSVCKGSASQVESKEAVSLKEQHPSNQYTFGVHQRNGSYSCFRCNASGNWYELKNAISGIVYEVIVVKSCFLHVRRRSFNPLKHVCAQETLQSASNLVDHNRKLDPGNEFLSSLEGRTEIGEGEQNVFRKYAKALSHCLPAITWLTERRGLHLQTLEKYFVGVAIYR
eukprot:761005-Hanusia_phi.AAC.2